MSSGSLQTKQTALVFAILSLITLLIINTCQMRDRSNYYMDFVAQWKSSSKTLCSAYFHKIWDHKQTWSHPISLTGKALSFSFTKPQVSRNVLRTFKGSVQHHYEGHLG